MFFSRKNKNLNQILQYQNLLQENIDNFRIKYSKILLQITGLKKMLQGN